MHATAISWKRPESAVVDFYTNTGNMSKRPNKSIKTSESPKAVKPMKVVKVNPLHEGNFYKAGFWHRYVKEIIVLAAMSFVLYHACIPFGYVLDDLMVITENNFTKKGISGIKDILTTESFTGYFGEQKNLVMGNRYRPLSIVTFAIEYELAGGLNPKLSHIINIFLYFISGLLLMQVLTMLFRNYKNEKWWLAIPFLAAVFFIAHPIHTEAVANIKGRDEIMSVIFSLLALYGALRYMDSDKMKWVIFTAGSFFLGLLSKENAITFLAVIPLSIYFFSQTNWGRMGKLMSALGVTTVAYLILRFNTAGVPDFNQQINDLMNNPFLGMTSAEKAGTILYTLGKYVMLMIFPHPLSHDYYPYAIPKVTILNIWSFASLVLYVFMMYYALRHLAKKSVIAFCILVYLATLSITSNIVINVGTFMNERFIYMASIAFCILLAYLISEKIPELLKNRSVLIASLVTGGILTGYSVKTLLRVPVWEDALSLNQSAVVASPNSARANSFMSTALFEKFKVTQDVNEKKQLLSESGKYAAKAIEILPDYSNANLMMIGVVAENYKLDYDIDAYTRDMKPNILRRPDIAFIKDFSDWINSRGQDSQKLFAFYNDVGTQLLQFSDFRRRYAQMYLEYAYNLYPNNKDLVEKLALAYEVNGNMPKAQSLRSAAQNMNE